MAVSFVKSLLSRDLKRRTKPTSYPFLPFHGLRCAQLLSSMIVASIMFYFIYHLTHDHWSTPWTFLLVSLRISELGCSHIVRVEVREPVELITVLTSFAEYPSQPSSPSQPPSSSISAAASTRG